MDHLHLSSMLLLLCALSSISHEVYATEVCSNTILPGSKGDQGEGGDEGDQGRLGKTGPQGQPEFSGELGCKGEAGRMGKMGPAGEKGDNGEAGTDGPTGLKGKPGTTCDCGRYRKVVGQLEVNVSKLKNAVKFVKHGIKENKDKFYLLVKEARRYREALMNCKLRGGMLAMPKSGDTNSLIADYVNQAGLTRVFIGLQTLDQERGHVYADTSPLQNYTAWGLGEPSSPSANASCVEMVSTGTWNRVECDITMYYVCEFMKNH